jgi:hypothetical protein
MKQQLVRLFVIHFVYTVRVFTLFLVHSTCSKIVTSVLIARTREREGSHIILLNNGCEKG